MKDREGQCCANCNNFGRLPPPKGVGAPHHASEEHRQCHLPGMVEKRKRWRHPSDWCREWRALPNKGSSGADEHSNIGSEKESADGNAE